MMKNPEEIVREHMFAKDAFSQWLGIEIKEIKEGFCQLKMHVRPEMANGFGIVHGGVTYALADSALAFAANTYGSQSVTVDGHLHYYQKISIDDVLTATASFNHKAKKISKIKVIIEGKNGLLAEMIGSVIHTKVNW